MSQAKSPRNVKEGTITALVGLGILGLALTALWYYQSNVQLAYAGPTKITAEDLGKVNHPHELPSSWVAFNFDRAIETEFQVVTKKAGSQRVEWKYLLVQTGDRWVIALVSPDFRGKTLAGELKQINHHLHSDMRNQITKKYAATHQGRLLAYEFHADIDYGENWIAFFWVMVGLGSIGLLIVVMGIYFAFSKPKPVPMAPTPVNPVSELAQRLSTAALLDRAVPRTNQPWHR